MWTCILPSDVVDDGVFGQATLNIELLICWGVFSFHMMLQTCLPLESCTTVLTRTDQPLQRSVLHANVHREILFMSIHGVAIFLWAHESFVFVGHIIESWVVRGWHCGCAFPFDVLNTQMPVELVLPSELCITTLSRTVVKLGKL